MKKEIILGTFSTIILLALGLSGCSSLPTIKVTKHKFPKGFVFIGEPKRPYEAKGWVKTKVTWNSLNPDYEESDLCKNYWNKAAMDLVKRAKENGADAVIDMRSVVFLIDGKQQTYPTPECTDDGAEGELLAQGIAVKWKPESPLEKSERKNKERQETSKKDELGEPIFKPSETDE